MESQFFLEKSKQIRHNILDMVYDAKSGHIGGSFSATELMVVLFYSFLKHNPKKLDDLKDYFTLSKGHATPVYYSILADMGYFPKEWLSNFRQIDSPLQGHPKNTIPGVDVSTGSLGQGFGNAAGIALALKLKNSQNISVCLLGDGELQEGVVWETMMAASHFKLNNLLAIIDYNGFQIDGSTQDIMKIDPVVEKIRAFGWDVLFIDGHSIEDIQKAYKYFYNSIATRMQPFMIVAKTVKGKGVGFMENTSAWHGKAPKKEEYLIAKEELNKKG